MHQLNSYSEVEKLVSKIQMGRISSILGIEKIYHLNFRGQPSNSFNLNPYLARFFNKSQDLLKVEKLLMDDFKNEMKSKIKNIVLFDESKNHQNEWSWLIQAQHYGLPTRLMDWTSNWEVALYFATDNNINFQNDDAQFWIFKVSDDILSTDTKPLNYFNINPYEIDSDLFVNPSFNWTGNYENEIAENWRARQSGKFFIQPIEKSLISLEKNPAYDKSLEKYIIPKTAKEEIRRELISKNICKEYLFNNQDCEIKKMIQSLCLKYKLTNIP